VLGTTSCECGPVLQQRTVEVSPGVSLFVASTTGRADSVLLVVHGGPDWDHSYLCEPLSQLGDRHRVVLPDLRGCGRSSRGLTEADYTPDAVVGDLLALADELGAQRFSLLGFSWGGLIAQRVAVAVPDRIERLIIASSGVLPVDAAAFGEWPEREERRAAEASVWTDRSLSGPQLTRAAAVASARANVWRAEALPGYLLRLVDVQFTAEWLRLRQAGTLLPARLEHPIRQLAATGIPILLLHGRYDMMFPVSSVEQAAAMLPSCQAVVLDEAGHMAHVDQPSAWLDAIAHFLR